MVVDVTMIPLVDMMNVDCLYDLNDSLDVTYETVIFPCDTLRLNNVEHVDSSTCDDFAIPMFCNQCLCYSPVVACNMLNNFSFTCVVCNNVDILAYEIAPIAFSPCGDFYSLLWTLFHPSLCIVTIHIYHIFHLILVWLVLCK